VARLTEAMKQCPRKQPLHRWELFKPGKRRASAGSTNIYKVMSGTKKWIGKDYWMFFTVQELSRTKWNWQVAQKQTKGSTFSHSV